jgi:rhamnosyltransferase
MTPTVVMRSRNDMPLIGETLAMLKRQKRPHDLVVFDNASTDGTVEEIRKYTDRLVHVPEGQYIPGRVINQGMVMAQSPYVVFVNSDCAPQHEDWLDELLAGFSDEKTAAVFGRQIPRPDCYPLYARDTEETFGEGERQKYWRHCFSMAASAICRSVWERMPFSERLQYSEDIDWTWRARQKGYHIRYAPRAVVTHSHNYTLRQLYRRQYGEGKAEAFIFEWSPWQRAFIRYSLLPFVRQVIGDWRYCLGRGLMAPMGYSPFMRMAGLLGRRKGFQDGWKARKRQEDGGS